MKVLSLPHSRKSLILFEKSGSSLMSNLVKGVCDWKGLEVRNSVDLKHSNMVLVVRDPINRFISSFFHTKIDKELEDDIPFNLIIDKFRDFLTYYEENSDKINDPHVYSQLWDYRKKGVDISDNPKFKIHHLEDIHKGFSEMRRGWKGTDNIDYKGMIHNFFEGVEFNNQLPIFKDLGIDLEKWDKFHIITLYYYTLTHLNNHHRNKSEGFRDVLKNRHSYLYNKMVKLFCKENDILGYKMDL